MPLSQSEKDAQMMRGVGLMCVAGVGMGFVWLSENGYLAKVNGGGVVSFFIAILWMVRAVFKRFAPEKADGSAATGGVHLLRGVCFSTV
jgi:hypothetical protein